MTAETAAYTTASFNHANFILVVAFAFSSIFLLSKSFHFGRNIFTLLLFLLQQLIRSTNEELSKLSLWFKANRLSLNITKTNYMLFSNRKKILNQNMNVIIDESIITRVKDCKFLGVIIDENLTWMKHKSGYLKNLQKYWGHA